MNPYVTVITPAYNAARFIPATIKSVKDQNYQYIRHIVIDDGSTDNTAEILSKTKGLTVVHQQNKGEHEAVNRALRMVETPYFIILNADDILLKDAVRQLAWFMEGHPYVLCAYPDISVINEDGSCSKECLPRPEYDFVHMVRYHRCLPSVGAIFRSMVINDVGLRDPDFHWTADFDYWLRIGLTGDMCRVPGVFAAWRKSAGQESAANRQLQAQEREKLLNKFFLMEVPTEIRNIESEARAWGYLVSASLSQRSSDVLRYLTKAIKVYPFVGVKIGFWHTALTRVMQRV